MRPNWLRYSVKSNNSIIVWGKQYQCKEIEAVALDSHIVNKYSGNYYQLSYVTDKTILKTEIKTVLPDTVDFLKYYRIDLIEEGDNTLPELTTFKSQIIERGWK